MSDKRLGKKRYTDNDVENTLDDINQRKMSLGQAAVKYNVPKTILHIIKTRKVPLKHKRGLATILSAQDEDKILEWVFFCCDQNFPVTKELLLNSAQKYIRELGIPNPFKDDRPGSHWYEAFKKRHPQLVIRVAQNLSLSRSHATPEKLRHWFQKVEQYLPPKNLL